MVYCNCHYHLSFIMVITFCRFMFGKVQAFLTYDRVRLINVAIPKLELKSPSHVQWSHHQWNSTLGTNKKYLMYSHTKCRSAYPYMCECVCISLSLYSEMLLPLITLTLIFLTSKTVNCYFDSILVRKVARNP